MEKVIRNGDVAILISEGYGAGWYSWYKHKELLFHPKLVEMVEQGKANQINRKWIEENLGIIQYICTEGASQLVIHWLPIGSAFEINVYDGDETLIDLGIIDLIA